MSDQRFMTPFNSYIYPWCFIWKHRLLMEKMVDLLHANRHISGFAISQNVSFDAIFTGSVFRTQLQKLPPKNELFSVDLRSFAHNSVTCNCFQWGHICKSSQPWYPFHGHSHINETCSCFSLPLTVSVSVSLSRPLSSHIYVTVHEKTSYKSKIAILDDAQLKV